MNKDQQRELERINDLKLRGQKIEVKIDDCKIVGGYDKIVDDGEVVSDFAAGELTAPLAVLYVFP
ncbi:MAG TPA: hypothetical protein VL651_02360, partial [Bacteroidia bacterium]|nr:hypothetical protein [Bacteroidia bacterium]